MPKKLAKRTKSKKLTKTSSRTKPAPPAPVKTREQLMDERARADFAHMDRINSDRSIEYRIMNDRGPRWAPQPSDRNAASQGVRLDDMTFSRLGATDPRFANNSFVQSRRRFGG